MNPVVWGPPLWRLMTDVALVVDRSRDPRINKYAVFFFQSLGFLLPCKWCRQSYQNYIIELPVEPFIARKETVRWVWEIKERVNDKLGKPPSVRLAYPLFLRRVNMCTHNSSPEDVLDILAIFGLNYHKSGEQWSTMDKLKKKYMTILHATLPVLLPYPNLTQLKDWKRFSPNDTLHSEGTYMEWLYKLRMNYNKRCHLPPLPPPSELWKKYWNARAEQKVPVVCPYVLDSSLCKVK
jgi:hypothetical protein